MIRPWCLLEKKKKYSILGLIIIVIPVHQIKVWKVWESTKKEINIARNFTPQIRPCEHLGVSPPGVGPLLILRILRCGFGAV